MRENLNQTVVNGEPFLRMTRAEERSYCLLEEVGHEVLAAFRPAPYTAGERAHKRLGDALATLGRVRETAQPDDPPEYD